MATIPNSNRVAEKRRLLQFHSHPQAKERSRFSRGVSKQEILDSCRDQITTANDFEEVSQVLDDLILRLREVRLYDNQRQWSEWVHACRQHRLLEILHQDPFTRRAYMKPRGYSGDAVLLDYIYGVEERWGPPQGISELGELLYRYTTNSPAPSGVRARRAYIAREIDRVAESVRSPNVLSIAAGHFREALLCQSVKRGRLGRIVAIDSDPESLAVVQSDYGHFGIETQPINVRALLTGKYDVGRFDLIYSLGLFDYLRDATCRRLVTTLFESLQPNGKLIIANFLPGIQDVGYMEAFMDWNLIYRTRREMIDMTMDIEQSKLARINIIAEENQNIIFLEITRSH